MTALSRFQRLCPIRWHGKADVLPALTGTPNDFLPASQVKRNFTLACPLPSPLPAAARPPELVTLELLPRCSLQSTFFGYDRIFTASRFGPRPALVAAEVQNLLAAREIGGRLEEVTFLCPHPFLSERKITW